MRGGAYRLCTDFSANLLSNTFYQVQALEKGSTEEVPLVFASQTCKGLEMHLDSPSGELSAVIFAFRKFKDYFIFAHFTLITKSTLVRKLYSQKKLSGKFAHWAVLFREFNFTVEHLFRVQQRNMDGLSCCPQDDSGDGKCFLQVWAINN